MDITRFTWSCSVDRSVAQERRPPDSLSVDFLTLAVSMQAQHHSTIFCFISPQQLLDPFDLGINLLPTRFGQYHWQLRSAGCVCREAKRASVPPQSSTARNIKIFKKIFFEINKKKINIQTNK